MSLIDRLINGGYILLFSAVVNGSYFLLVHLMGYSLHAPSSQVGLWLERSYFMTIGALIFRDATMPRQEMPK